MVAEVGSCLPRCDSSSFACDKRGISDVVRRGKRAGRERVARVAIFSSEGFPEREAERVDQGGKGGKRGGNAFWEEEEDFMHVHISNLKLLDKT